ncbi:MAG: chemotaxis protein CheA [Campylobacterota bacterium]|nr:chemotaxis protein CheA [Campylobacterota bacterium]
MDAILEQFLGEARENLSFLDRNLEQLSSGNPEIMNALFRAAHTLKGGAGLVGLDGIKNITHYAEDLLDGIKKGEIVYTEDMLDVLYDAFDEIVEMVDATEETGDVPHFDEQRIAEIANSVKALTGKEDDEQNQSIDTDLNIITNPEDYFAQLISHHNIGSFIEDLPFDQAEITNEFLEEDNFYLIDMDLDEQTCEVGNDPIYLAYLIGDESIYSVSTSVFGDCSDILEDPMSWKTRLSIVVKSSKEVLEDNLYNIVDDIQLYPMSVKSLFKSNYESVQNDIFDDFATDFKANLEQNNYAEFSENLSAVTKILNPETKEGFALARLELILPHFEFEGIDYLEIIKDISLYLGLSQEEKSTENCDETDDEDNKAQELSTVISALKQQLKVLKFAKDDMALSRVLLHSKTSLEFIDIESNFHVDDDKQSLAKKIVYYILELNPDEDLSKFTEFTSEDEEIVKEIIENEKADIIEEVKALEEEIKEEVQEVQHPEDVEDEIVEQIEEDVENEIVEPVEVQEEKKERKVAPTKATPAPVPKTVKIDQSDIDGMMDIIGELLVMKNALPYVANNISVDTVAASKTELTTKYEEINRVTEQLQDLVMGMRLLPLSYIFSRYPKLVRETSKKLNKKIRFEEYGGDTKLDKMMIEKIADPLVHIIRNSLDHGIEPTQEDRIKAGKEPQGFIKVGARSEGDKVKIIIEDDGRGIDVQKVLIKALELGITTEEQTEAMSEQEKLMMIFNPGLSTADEITDISGRGVGTDAVMKTITELNGNIHLKSVSGEGTTVTIELPVSVALTNVFCVKMNSNNYAIAMENVIETIKIVSKDMQIANNKPYARLRGEIIPLVFEPRLLAVNQIDEEVQSVVIVQSSTMRYGLVVNEFVNQLDVVQKPLDGAIANHPMISGTSLLGNGEILFVLDINSIVE